jgi:hypothetical protein
MSARFAFLCHYRLPPSLQTEGGKYLDGLQLFGEKTLLTKRQAANIWDIASRRYSVNARGDVHFFSYKEDRLNPR